MTVEELTIKESRLMDAVDQTVGLMEDQIKELEEKGIFEAYRDIHRSYVELANLENNLEALKRAVFLQWFAFSEPGCFTGLGEIDEDAAKMAFLLVEKLIKEDKVDKELEWMLPYYYEIAEWYIIFSGFNELKRFSERDEHQLWPNGKPTISSIENRGQLSRYWLSIWEQH